jgi:hypothetical protein
VSRDSTKRVELERDILRAICRSYGKDEAVHAAKQALRGYAWRDTEHGVIFEAIERTRAKDAAELRRELPAQATRMGFPDVNWELYFEAGSPQRGGELGEWIQELKTLGQE